MLSSAEKILAYGPKETRSSLRGAASGPSSILEEEIEKKDEEEMKKENFNLIDDDGDEPIGTISAAGRGVKTGRGGGGIKRKAKKQRRF